MTTTCTCCRPCAGAGPVERQVRLAPLYGEGAARRAQLLARAGTADEHPGHPEPCGRAGSLESRLRACELEVRGQQPSRRRRHAEPVPVVVSEVAATCRPARRAVSARGLPAGCFRL